VTLKLKNGKEHSTSIKSWKGHYTSPLAIEELATKYKDATGDTLSPGQTDRSMELVLNLEKMNNVADLMQILTFPG
jgi:hypothetical protein